MGHGPTDPTLEPRSVSASSCHWGNRSSTIGSCFRPQGLLTSHPISLPPAAWWHIRCGGGRHTALCLEGLSPFLTSTRDPVGARGGGTLTSAAGAVLS